MPNKSVRERVLAYDAGIWEHTALPRQIGRNEIESYLTRSLGSVLDGHEESRPGIVHGGGRKAGIRDRVLHGSI